MTAAILPPSCRHLAHHASESEGANRRKSPPIAETRMNLKLQQNSDLTMTNWTDVTTTPTLNLTNLQNEMMVSSPSIGNSFYRLKSP